ncbi:MAG: MFS transporter [Planctomycetales bacterium]
MIGALPSHETSLAGTARLPIVVIVALTSFLFANTLEYALPLYFNSLEGFPADVWSQLVLWQVMPWIVMPFVAGLLARRFGERRVWSAALFGQSLVPIALLIAPEPWVVRPVALWSGLTGALMWVGGVSLVQVVPADRKGLANGLMMMSMGVGSTIGPLLGRTVLWREHVTELVSDGGLSRAGAFLINLSPPPTDAPLGNFRLMLGCLSGLAICGAVLIGLFGQRPGRVPGEEQAPGQTLVCLRELMVTPRFWALTLSLCLLGGPVFQATNQFLKYRAEDVGLIVGAQDHGWIWLQLLRTFMWIPGGLAVGLLAGRRAPGIAAVVMLASFALAGGGIGLVVSAGPLFAVVAVFEFVRQFMRWSHAGYLSEHLPGRLRSTAIGCAISLAGVGSTLYGSLPLSLMDAKSTDFDSRLPFWISAALGLAGATCLLVFDRLKPIRQHTTATTISIPSPQPGSSASNPSRSRRLGS